MKREGIISKHILPPVPTADDPENSHVVYRYPVEQCTCCGLWLPAAAPGNTKLPGAVCSNCKAFLDKFNTAIQRIACA